MPSTAASYRVSAVTATECLIPEQFCPRCLVFLRPQEPAGAGLKSRLLELMRNGSTGAQTIESGGDTLRRR
jgi:hypothetical protein